MYETSGEFVDVLSGQMWQLLREPVLAALGAPAAGGGPLVDMGAGTGLGTLVLAAARPATEILAVEPSPVQRAVLLARVAADPDLRARVTVLAGDATGGPLPAQLGGVVALNMLGHLDRGARSRFFARIAHRLAPGAPLVLNVQPPVTPAVVDYATFGTVRIGRHRYEGGGSARPSGDDAVIWSMRYRVLDDEGATVREAAVDHPWHVLSVTDLLAELSRAGLSGQAGPFDVVRAVTSG
jgi:hypothetical protein